MNEILNLSKRDRKTIWHPLTQEKTAPLPIAIARGKGAWLYDVDGKAYLDLISSWWVNLHGHSHPDIASAIYEQAKTLEHVIFAGFTHEPAVKLCEKLKTILPKGLSRFFFADNGSTAIEVAIKVSYQFWWNIGEKQRAKFISFHGGYHGDTLGAMSVGDIPDFQNKFQKFLFDTLFIPFPDTWDNDPDVFKKEENSINVLTDILKKHHNEIVAFICEPILQGAGGMRMCRPEYLAKVIKVLRSYNILIIFDEIMTGFYRTGRYFASDYIETKPDIICLSKGLTGGFLPLSLTVTTEIVYQAFLDDDFSKAFAHSHSYTANPLGCAAALASFDLLVSDETEKAIKNIENLHRSFLDEISKISFIKAPRMLGTIVAFNLEKEHNNYQYEKTPLLKKKFLEAGMLIRPLGNTIYLMPPYCINTEELKYAYNKIIDIV